MKAQTKTNGLNPENLAPSFIDKDKLSEAQLTDPDYRLKNLERLYGHKYPISCSKCHHCR